MKRLLMAALVAVTTLTASALAQKNELTGIIGRTFVSDQGVLNTNLFDNNLRFGEGLTFEVNYGRHLMGNSFANLTVEVPPVFNFDQDIHFAANLVPSGYSNYFVTPSLRANAFAGNVVSPWVSVGGGIGHFGPSDNLEFRGTSPAKGKFTESFRQVSAWTCGSPIPSLHAVKFAISGRERPTERGYWQESPAPFLRGWRRDLSFWKRLNLTAVRWR